MPAVTINSGLQKFLPEAKIDSLSPDGAKALSYYAKVLDLRDKNPNVVLVHNVNDLPKLMEKYFWSREQVVESLHSSVDWWNQHIAEHCRYLFINQFIRRKFAQHLKTTDRRVQNANKIYSPEEIAATLQKMMKATVVSVLVPLPFLSKHPYTMRQKFEELLEERLPAINGRDYRTYPPLYEWDEILDLVEPLYRPHVGKWHDDIKSLAREQGRQQHRVTLKEYKVTYPDGILPVFRRNTEVAFERDYVTRSMGETTVRSQGWTKNMIEGSNRTLFTPGVAVGGEEYACDYRTGLLDLWTAERYVEVFGEESLKKWPLRFGSTDIAWQKKDSITTFYDLPPYLAKLTGQRFLANLT